MDWHALATRIGAQERNGFYVLDCPRCGGNDALALSARGFHCRSELCGWSGTNLSALEQALGAARPTAVPAQYREAARVPDAAQKSRPPTLAETWDSELDSFLDPNPFLLRPSEAGMGPELNRILGGGLSVGQTVAIGARSAGAGKTAWLHQLADGLAAISARTAQHPGYATPVVYVSELTTRDMSLRSLARAADVEGYLLRDPQGQRGSEHLAGGMSRGEWALERAREAAKRLRHAADHLTVIDRRQRVTLHDLPEIIRRVRASWEENDIPVPAVTLVIDPLHRVIDLTKPEVEALGLAVTACIDVAQRENAIVIFTSDTTFAAASSRRSVSSLKRADELADASEMAFRGSYQLLHLPDVALGILTMRADDENLTPEDAKRLAAEPPGTLYAEVASAKSRWEDRGLRAAYWYEPAKFRFRPTTSRVLPRDEPIEARILAFVEGHPDCSENAVRKGIDGRDTSIRKAIQRLLSDGRLLDLGDRRSGRRLRVGGTPLGTRAEQPGNNLPAQVGRPGVVPGGSPLRGESPPGGTTPLPAPGAELASLDHLLSPEASR
ncbi:MAG TPA: hypothetical protein VFQ22_08000 [Longimicrobiales bacterium]|nr:hypothetical protein [Longimicrobiales bacterium]